MTVSSFVSYLQAYPAWETLRPFREKARVCQGGLVQALDAVHIPDHASDQGDFPS